MNPSGPMYGRVQDLEDFVVRRRFHLPLERQDHGDASLTAKDINKAR